VGKSPSQVTMINKIVKHFPISDNFANVEFKIPKTVYTTEEVDALIDSAVAEAKAIDEASMKKHNRDATVISMILGFTTLALFVDGLLRMLGIIPPFMHIDINILDKIEGDMLLKLKTMIK
jgi:hypothetical protein